MKRLALLLLLCGLHPMACLHAQGPFYPIVVNGSTEINSTYDNGVLTVRFHRTLRGAGNPDTYTRNVIPGAGAWVDRPLNANEPLVLQQVISPEQADAAIKRLHQNGGYWRFFCRNTNHGFFEVQRSEAAYASVRID